MSTWIQKAEENIEMFTSQGKGAEAARMLEVTPANKIVVDRDQGILLQINLVQENLLANAYASVGNNANGEKKEYAYEWYKNLIDGCMLTQATLDGKTRADFKEVAIAQGVGIANKAKNELQNLMVK